MKKIVKFKVFGLVVFIFSIFLLGLLLDLSKFTSFSTLTSYVEKNIFLAIIIFVFVSVVLKFFMTPMSPVTVIAGTLFGVGLGIVLSLVVLTTSSIIMFSIGRLLGREYVERMVEEKSVRLKKYNQKLKEHGLLTVILLRNVPVAPLGIVNLVLGTSMVGTRDFILGSILGFLPGTVLLASIGNYIKDYSDPMLYVLLVIYLLLIAVSAKYSYNKK